MIDDAWWGRVQPLVDMAEDIELPPSSHLFDVPSVPEVPTEDDVRRATERLIELEAVSASIPDLLRAIDDLSASLAFNFPQQDDVLAAFEVMTAAWERVRSARDAWMDFQQLIAQQIGHWQSAVAVMEHDIAWQEYETASGMRQARRRPSPSAALAVARESWIRV